MVEACNNRVQQFLEIQHVGILSLKKVKNSGRKVVPVKLAFNNKGEIDRSVHFKSICVVLDFMMVLDIDFDECFSYVVADNSLKVQIGINLKNVTKDREMRVVT